MEERYVLSKTPETVNGWILQDRETKVTISFEEHRFNETQKVAVPESLPMSVDTASRLAGILSAMGDWLSCNHYFIAFEEPDNIREKISILIKMAMKEKGITYKDLSEVTGYNPSNICDIANGKVSVGIDVLNNILSALGKKLDVTEK